LQITSATVVCSKHFRSEDCKGWNPVRKRLNPEAIPTIFNWQQPKTPRRSLQRKVMTSVPHTSTARIDEDEEGPSLDQVCLDSDIKESNALLDDKDAVIKDLEEKLKQKSDECEYLSQQLKLEKFGIYRFSRDNTMVNFYTGFQTYDTFLAFYRCIEPTAQNMQSAYYQSSKVINLAGRKRNMLLIDELFIFLCRLHMGLLEQDLSIRFKCSVPTVSRKIVTWANFLYFVLGTIPIWLTKTQIQDLMPECFKSTYPNTRVIIDCIEIKTQQPSSLILNSQLYSKYKWNEYLQMSPGNSSVWCCYLCFIFVHRVYI
jgi:hypothetical protein